MTAPFIPSDSLPRPPAFVPGSRGLNDLWRRYLGTPYVADTLARILGPEQPPVQISSGPAPAGQERLRGGMTNLGNLMMYEDPNDDLLTHETGHVVDARQMAPQITDSLRSLFSRQRPPDFTYESATGDLPSEYVAETFRTAMALLRASTTAQRDSTERAMPGTNLWYDWMLSRLNPK